MSTSLEQDLLRIFHWYSVLDPLKQSVVTQSRLHEIVRDCGLQGGRLQYGHIDLAFVETRPTVQPGTTSGLDFAAFVECMSRLATRRYGPSVPNALYYLEVNHVAPLAHAIEESETVPNSLSLLHDAEWLAQEADFRSDTVQRMFDHVRPGLQRLFEQYAPSQSTPKGASVTYRVLQRSWVTLSFDEFLRLCRHMDLCPALLSVLQLWRIFHQCNGNADRAAACGMDVLDYAQFEDALRRCCLTAITAGAYPHWPRLEQRTRGFVAILSAAHKQRFGRPLESISASHASPRRLPPSPALDLPTSPAFARYASALQHTLLDEQIALPAPPRSPSPPSAPPSASPVRQLESWPPEHQQQSQWPPNLSPSAGESDWVRRARVHLTVHDALTRSRRAHIDDMLHFLAQSPRRLPTVSGIASPAGSMQCG